MRSANQTIRTKLVATLGPATAEPRTIANILEGGVDVCRLNFSHGTHDDHARTLRIVRDWAREHDRPIAVLGDLCGPKIRLNRVGGDRLMLTTGQALQIVRGTGDCTREQLTTSYAPLVDEAEVGQRLFIDDGLVRLLITDKQADVLHCTCTVGGEISSRKGVNLPDTRLSVPALTEKDLRDVVWAVENQLDYVALSFVRRPEDLQQLRERLRELGGTPGVIVKIEKFEALEYLDELVADADAVMVARGDLGVEMDVWQVPLVQKAITARCRAAAKPVIIATQMLQSMVSNPTPTRAEVSDVANAILDGADAVMLSAETAAGQFPGAAVEIMARVAHSTEAYQSACPPLSQPDALAAQAPRTFAIAHAAVQAARDLGVKLVAAWTATGATVRLLAQHRLAMPIVGLTYDERVYRRLNLLYGVIPMRVEPIREPARMVYTLDQRLMQSGLAQRGDLIVVVSSTRPSLPGETDTTMIHRVGGPD